MPVTLRQILVNTATTPIAFAGETINVTYRPAGVTEKWIMDCEISNNTDADTAMPLFCEAMAGIITAWDLYETYETDDKGVVNSTLFPLDPIRLRELPLGLLGAIYRKIRSSASDPNTIALQEKPQNSSF